MEQIISTKKKCYGQILVNQQFRNPSLVAVISENKVTDIYKPCIKSLYIILFFLYLADVWDHKQDVGKFS